MPSFDTHATIVALKNFSPLVGLKFLGVKKGDAGLPVIRPGDKLTVVATVHNPSPKLLPKGEAILYLPLGWSIDSERKSVGQIKPWDSRTVAFRVLPPKICAQRTLRPLVVKYVAGEHISTPSTQLVWWQTKDTPLLSSAGSDSVLNDLINL